MTRGTENVGAQRPGSWKAICSGAALSLLFVTGVPGFGLCAETVSVATYGAKPDDGIDDTGTVQAALDSCRGKKDVQVVFPRGVYDFGKPGKPYDARLPRGDRYFITFDSVDGLVVEGNGSTLVGHEQVALILIRNCRHVRMQNLSVDWDPPGYTTGKVLAAIHNSHFDMEVVSPHTARGGDTIQRVLGYNPVTRRLADDAWYEKPRHVGLPIELARPNVMRVFIPGKQPPVGSHVIAFHIVYGSDAFNVLSCSDVTLENVNLYTCPGSGFVGRQSRDITLRRFRVMPKPGTARALTTTADLSHFADCRGVVTFEDCVLESGADDATNIHSFHYRVSERVNDTTIAISSRGRGVPPLPEPGDKIEISGMDKPMVPYVAATVKSAVADAKGRALITFEQPLPARTREGDIVANASAVPAFRALRCTIRNIRPRGFLLQTRDIIVDGCTFEHTTASGIHMGSDVHYWWEGIGVRRAVIRNCRFINCNFDGNINRGGRHGAIDINARANTNMEQTLATFGTRTEDEMTDWKLAPAGVHQDIVIENNFIQAFNSLGAGIYLGSVDGAIIRNNTVVSPVGAAFEISESRNVVLTGNTVIDAKVGLTIDPSCEKATIKVEGNTGF